MTTNPNRDVAIWCLDNLDKLPNKSELLDKHLKRAVFDKIIEKGKGNSDLDSAKNGEVAVEKPLQQGVMILYLCEPINSAPIIIKSKQWKT